MGSATLSDPMREQPVDGDGVGDALGSAEGAASSYTVMRSETLWDPMREQ